MYTYIEREMRGEINIPDPGRGLFLYSGFATKGCKSVLCNYENHMRTTFDDIGG